MPSLEGMSGPGVLCLLPTLYERSNPDEFEMIVVQIAEPATPSPAASPASSPGAPVHENPIATISAVTRLPETGSNGSDYGASTVWIAMLAASLIATMAIGIRVRSSRD